MPGVRGRRRPGRPAGRGDRRGARPPGDPIRGRRPHGRADRGSGPDAGRAGFGVLTRDLAAQARRAGVRLETSHPVDAEFLRAERPDAVVLATGAVPVQPAWRTRIPGGRRPPGGRRIGPARGHRGGLDELGFHPATSVAELLADRGCAVEVMTSAMVVGQDLGLTLDLELWTRNARPGRPAAHGRGGAGRPRGRGGPPGAHAAAPPDRNSARGGLRLGGLRGPARPADELWHALHVPARMARPSSCTGWVTAWPRAGPTPRCSRASGREPPYERSQHRDRSQHRERPEHGEWPPH